MQSGILLMKAFVTRQYLDSAIHAVFIHGLKKLNNWKMNLKTEPHRDLCSKYIPP